MKKENLQKGELSEQWKINKKLYDEALKEYLQEDICFGEMYLPKIPDFPEEIIAKTRKDAEQKLAQIITDSINLIKERIKQIKKCKNCQDFHKCFNATLLSAIRDNIKSF